MIVFVCVCQVCAAIAIVAYVRWKLKPNSSISQGVARWGARNRDSFKIGLVVGIGIGVSIGTVAGMFLGHWFWPVELVTP